MLGDVSIIALFPPTAEEACGLGPVVGKAYVSGMTVDGYHVEETPVYRGGRLFPKTKFIVGSLVTISTVMDRADA